MMFVYHYVIIPFHPQYLPRHAPQGGGIQRGGIRWPETYKFSLLRVTGPGNGTLGFSSLIGFKKRLFLIVTLPEPSILTLYCLKGNTSTSYLFYPDVFIKRYH